MIEIKMKTVLIGLRASKFHWDRTFLQRKTCCLKHNVIGGDRFQKVLGVTDH